MTEWIPGMFYDVGGAAALYWPDQHPEHPDPALAQRWLVFDPWGGLEVITGRPPRDDAPIEREMGLAPFLRPPDPQTSLRELPKEVWHRLEDQQTLADPELTQSIEEMRRGEWQEL